MEITFAVSPGETGVRLGLFLRRRGASTALVRSVKFTEGGLSVNGEGAHTNRVLCAGEVVAMRLPGEKFSAMPQDLPLRIVYESPHAMVVEKEAGRVMHPTFTHHEGTLANAFCGLMQKRGEERVFRSVGRLDADTSGLVLCAMNAYSAPGLARSLQKVYYALVGGMLPPGEGCIDAPLGPQPHSAILQRVHPAGKPSVTRYTVLAAAKGASLVEVRPESGRTHQIRVHFAHSGHPLLGDGLYGGDKSFLRRHALHCGRLAFTEPGGERVRLTSPLPPDMQRAVEALIEGQ